jgi:hypothetical protein
MASIAHANSVSTLLQERYEFLNEVRTHLCQAQDYSKHHYDGHHRDLTSIMGD